MRSIEVLMDREKLKSYKALRVELSRLPPGERREMVDSSIKEIESWILGISDATDRVIFSCVFLDGLSYREVGYKLSMDYSWICRRIQKYV